MEKRDAFFNGFKAPQSQKDFVNRLREKSGKKECEVMVMLLDEIIKRFEVEINPGIRLVEKK